MRRSFLVSAAVSVALIVAAFIGLGAVTGYGRQGDLNKESKAYIDRVLPVIVSSWDRQELINHASAEFLRFNPPEMIDKWFGRFSQGLGCMREYCGSRGNARVDNSQVLGRITTAVYEASAVFEKAPATIQVAMILRGDKWEILEFRLHSDAFSR